MDYDVQYQTVALRLPFNEADGATTITDVSLRPKTVTLVNAEVDDAVALFGRALKLDGTGRLHVASSSEFDFPAATPFTIDLAFYPTTNTGTQCLLSKRAGASAIAWLDVRWDGTQLRLRTTGDGSQWSFDIGLGGWNLNAWNRLRITREASGSAYVYVNGTLRYGISIGGLFFDASPLCIGATGADGGQPFIGWIDEVRIKKGHFVGPRAESYNASSTDEFDVAPWTLKTEMTSGVRVIYPAETPLPKILVHRPLRALRNFIVPDGNGRIVGTVKEKNTPENTPLRRRVVLLRDVDAQVLAETFSDPVTGAYEFTGLRTGLRYTTLAFDHEHNYRAVVADNLEPVL